MERSAATLQVDQVDAGASVEAVRTVRDREDNVSDDQCRAADAGDLSTVTGTTVANRQEDTHRWQRLRTTLDLIRSNPTGRFALKVIVAIAGALVVAVGAALIPLPGPGWLLVIAGLGIWAVEFHWARRLLAFTRRHVHAWTQWIGRQSWPVRLMAGAVGMIFVGTVVWLSLKYSLGIDVIAEVLAYLATH